MKDKIFRIAMIGPESSGKTFLARALAEHFNTTWTPEYARNYIGNLNRRYTKKDILHCAKMQYQSECAAIEKADRLFFTDTEMINNRVWLLDVFNETNDWIEDNIASHPYDLYLLLTPDLPFEHDPVRENEHRREHFFNWYKSELESRGLTYVIISGTGKERMMNAVTAIEKLVQSTKT